MFCSSSTIHACCGLFLKNASIAFFSRRTAGLGFEARVAGNDAFSGLPDERFKLVRIERRHVDVIDDAVGNRRIAM